MNCLAWNCRGVANDPTVRDLVGLVRAANAKLIFLCETHQKANKVCRLRGRLGLGGFAGCDSQGLSGGLALFWCDQIHVEIKEIKERYINAYIRLSDDAPLWHLTCVYGEPRIENRHPLWIALQDLKA